MSVCITVREIKLKQADDEKHTTVQTAEPLDDEARQLPAFKWAPKEIGRRHQLGGKPQFLQDERWPNCPSGHGRMTFYGQLDSISDDICIADCGMIYVLVCFDCYESVSFVQSG